MSDTALCALISAVSEGGISSPVTAWFANAADRAAVGRAIDALALLDPGQAAGDNASWQVSLAPNPAAPRWWRGGVALTREIQVDGRWQAVTVYCCEAQ